MIRRLIVIILLLLLFAQGCSESPSEWAKKYVDEHGGLLKVIYVGYNKCGPHLVVETCRTKEGAYIVDKKIFRKPTFVKTYILYDHFYSSWTGAVITEYDEGDPPITKPMDMGSMRCEEWAEMYVRIHGGEVAYGKATAFAPLTRYKYHAFVVVKRTALGAWCVDNGFWFGSNRARFITWLEWDVKGLYF